MTHRIKHEEEKDTLKKTFVEQPSNIEERNDMKRYWNDCKQFYYYENIFVNWKRKSWLIAV